jgi:hypothetical protein
MYAMTLNWQLCSSLEEYEFSTVSDKLRDQLIEGGMPPRDATIRAPIILDGLERAHRGEFDFARIRRELRAEYAEAASLQIVLD